LLELANIGGIPTFVLTVVPALVLTVWLARRYSVSTLCDYFADRNRGAARAGWKFLYVIALLIESLPAGARAGSPDTSPASMRGFKAYDERVTASGEDRAFAIIERWQKRHGRSPNERVLWVNTDGISGSIDKTDVASGDSTHPSRIRPCPHCGVSNRISVAPGTTIACGRCRMHFTA
jgi:hypothetical protein